MSIVMRLETAASKIKRERDQKFYRRGVSDIDAAELVDLLREAAATIKVTTSSRPALRDHDDARSVGMVREVGSDAVEEL
jgi:hypothetical protein